MWQMVVISKQNVIIWNLTFDVAHAFSGNCTTAKDSLMVRWGKKQYVCGEGVGITGVALDFADSQS